jgi:hypothetical protein
MISCITRDRPLFLRDFLFAYVAGSNPVASDTGYCERLVKTLSGRDGSSYKNADMDEERGVILAQLNGE